LEVYSIFLGLDREKIWLYFGYITLARNYYYHLYNCASGHYSMPSLYFMLKMNEVWWTEEIAACFKPEKRVMMKMINCIRTTNMVQKSEE